MTPPTVTVELPRREAVLALPRVREIVLACFQVEGWQLRDENDLRYTVACDHTIRVDVSAPFRCTIISSWVKEVARLTFWFSDLMMPTGTAMPLVPIGPSQPGMVLQAGEILPPPPDPNEPPALTERESRVIEI